MLSKILTQSALTVILPPLKPFTMSRDHKLFPALLEAVNEKDEDAVMDIIDMASRVQTYSKGAVSIQNGQVYCRGELVHNLVADRILEMNAANIDFTFMARFLDNLMDNPSFTSRQELYLFLENGNVPITDDGRFLAYKWVKDDYFDVHTGKFAQNIPGAVVKMERGKVDDRRENTCSYGLHVCTHAYTTFGSRLMVVAVNPKHVVSVPSDYNNSKMRVEEYEVLYELPADEYKQFDDGPMVNVSSYRDGDY